MVEKMLIIIFSISLVVSLFLNNINELSTAIIGSGAAAVKIILGLIGPMALWGGVMEVARKSGLTDKLCKFLKKPLHILFPDLKDDKDVLQIISMNVISNLLGLGNAATPLGIKAMKELDRKEYKSKNMAMLTVLNASSIQLIPITVAAMRQAKGSVDPWDILPAVLIVSAIALTAGCIMVKVLYTDRKRESL